MSEELKPVEGNVEDPSTKELITATEPQLSEIEQKALDMGWRPKEEFDGDESDFIDAQEFVRRKPLFDKIDSVGRELKETRKALKALQAHHEKVREAEYQHALQTLRNEKKNALEEGNADKLIAIDERISEVKAQRVAEANIEQNVSQERHPNFQNWAERNQWYDSDSELKQAADAIGIAYAANNPDTHPDEVLEHVAKRIKKLYPEKFTNPNRSRPSAVEGNSSTRTSPKAASDLDDVVLTEDEKKAMNTFIRQGILTKAEYLAEIKKIRGHA